MVNINGQNLLFDKNGKQIKGHLVRVNGVVRYFDPNSGEMAVNRWVEVSPDGGFTLTVRPRSNLIVSKLYEPRQQSRFLWRNWVS